MDEPTPTPPEAPNDPCPRCGQPVGDAWLVCAWCGAQIAAPAELPVGATLSDGRYQVLGIIGRGGFGITYEVGDTRLKRRVAVKELFPDSAVRHGSMVLTPPHARVAFRASRDRFLREARVLARFTHPGIVRVYEVFEEHGTAYLVMERLHGRTLVDILRSRGEPFSQDEVLDVAGRAAAALRPVHAAGVLHRDINPSNIMLTDHGRIVVIDFGLARDFDPEQTVGMTRMVTPGYAPLEQYRGEGRFGPSTDVYGLAATCYRLLTGRVPVAAIERDAGAAIDAPHRVNPACSKQVSDAILDGLELEPGHRPQDLDSFLARLGIRHLPDGPRSVLLGTVGATPADLATPDLPSVDVAPPPVPPLPSPGPAAVVPTKVGAADTDVTDEPASGADTEGAAVGEIAGAGEVARSQLLTELAPRPAPPSASPPPPSAEPPASLPDVDPDRTEVPGAPSSAAPAWAAAAGPVDSDRTRIPGAAADGPDPDDPDRTYVPPSAGGWAVGTAEAPPLVDPGPAADPLGRARGRRLVTLPLAVLAVAAGSAAPILVLAIVVLLALPALATVGDGVARRRRSADGETSGWLASRTPSPLIGVVRFVRNVAMSVLRTSPILGVTAVGLGIWYALSKTSLPQGVIDVSLRLIGGGAVAVLLATSAEGSPRFRSGLGIDRLVERFAPSGKVNEQLVVGWIVIAALVAVALWLSPDAFPLR